MEKKFDLKGLTDSEVKESKEKYGVNQLSKKETESIWSMFIGAFDDVWIKIFDDCGHICKICAKFFDVFNMVF